MSTIELLGFSDEDPTANFTAEEWLDLFAGDSLRAEEALLCLSDVQSPHPERRLKWTKVPQGKRSTSGVVDTNPWRRGVGAPELREGAFAD